MTLTDAACRNTKPEARPRKLSDGGGLYLLVQPNGSKLWRLDYRFEGKRKTLAFGAYPGVKLVDARGRRDLAKGALSAGRDPSVSPMSENPGVPTFKSVALEWHNNKSPSWVPAHAARVLSRLEHDVFPALGKMPIDSIEAPMILDCLRKVEARGVRDTTRRLRQSISSVFRYAIATRRAARDPAADLKDALRARPRTKHRAALKAHEVESFFARLATYDGEPETPIAVEFVMRTMCRTNEARFAKWGEFEDDLWRIPAERMKMQREHLVPMTPSIRDLLDGLSHDSEWVFPGIRGKPISANTMIYAMYRMGYLSRATIHGMRGLASTVLNESGLWSPDAIERQLAHVPQNEVRAAYNAALYWPERNRMMAWWNDWIDDKKSMGELLG